VRLSKNSKVALSVCDSIRIDFVRYLPPEPEEQKAPKEVIVCCMKSGQPAYLHTGEDIAIFPTMDRAKAFLKKWRPDLKPSTY